jgi:valyl-tRNA synthetase
MDKTYSPKNIEQSCYENWEEEGYFSPQGEGSPYCIMLPPPNVTGSLHMGHGFQHTLMDALVRYHRMLGESTLWQPGTDHAGISTQMVVERGLNAQGKSKQDFSREDFVAKIWEWKELSGGNIGRQLRRMGSSLDWERERFTLDEGLSAAVQKVFIQLYHEGLIYRGQRLVNWDPKLGTAVSDLEVISTEEKGTLWHIRYHLADETASEPQYIIIATTRPETLFGDTAVAVNPNDSRYQSLIGKMLKLPLTDRKIPVIADESIDQEFGTGCVKITPAHDFNDYEIGKRHQLNRINILNKDATLNHEVPEQYQGLDRFVARKQLIAELKTLGLLEKEEPHISKIPRGEKSEVVIEPYLTEQWYVSMKPLAEPAIEAVRTEKIRFIPEGWTKTYFQWMENLEDWCISRQLWWGHRIPAWYDELNNIYVGYSEEDVRFKHKLSPETVLRQDEDVLDTWFSSALWPFSTLGWPEATPELKKFYPTNVLVTGFDIIFFWVARMIMMGLKFTGKIPFNEVYITGLIRDSDGQKMSKSKGNVIDPIDIIDGISLEDLLEKRTAHLLLGSQKDKIVESTKKTFPKGIPGFGTDALRFTFCALASPTRNINFDLNRVEGYRNFCNKLWNAARFVMMNTEQGENEEDWDDGAFEYSPADRFILSQLQRTVELAHHYFQQYRFDLLVQTLYEFTWHEYCDWYVEFSKIILNSESALDALKRATRKTLIQVLETILRLLHPLIPFITEEIWQKLAPMAGKPGETIMLQRYPIVHPELIDSIVEEEINWVKEVTLAIRNIRGERNIAPGKKLTVFVHNGSEQDKANIKKYRKSLMHLAKLEHLYWLKDEKPVMPATALVGELEVLVSMEGAVDQTEEKERLMREITKMEKSLQLSQNRLNNPDFIAKAPEALVTKEKDTSQQLTSAIQQLKEKLLALS